MLQIARGELEETRYFMLLSAELGRIKTEEFDNLNAQCDSVGKLINGLGRALRAKLKGDEDLRIASHKAQVTKHESRVTFKN